MVLAALSFSRVKQLGNLDGKCPEPSGIAYHAQRGTLFVAGDRGHLVEIARDGTLLQSRHLERGLDLEGITVGPDGVLYLSAEKQPPTIIAVDPDALQILERWQVDQDFGGRIVIATEPDKGLEGLCYLPEAGQFFAINQADPALLVELELSALGARSQLARVSRIVAELDAIVRARASDLAYDSVSQHLLVLESDQGAGKGEVYEITLDGRFLRRIKLPGKDQEGMALDDRGSLFIAQDGSGEILRLDP